MTGGGFISAKGQDPNTRFLVKHSQAKVHVIRDGRPLCGGGNGGKSVRQWQEDIGPANCRACALKLLQMEAAKERKERKAKEAVSA